MGSKPWKSDAPRHRNEIHASPRPCFETTNHQEKGRHTSHVSALSTGSRAGAATGGKGRGPRKELKETHSRAILGGNQPCLSHTQLPRGASFLISVSLLWARS